MCLGTLWSDGQIGESDPARRYNELWSMAHRFKLGPSKNKKRIVGTNWKINWKRVMVNI